MIAYRALTGVTAILIPMSCAARSAPLLGSLSALTSHARKNRGGDLIFSFLRAPGSHQSSCDKAVHQAVDYTRSLFTIISSKKGWGIP